MSQKKHCSQAVFEDLRNACTEREQLAGLRDDEGQVEGELCELIEQHFDAAECRMYIASLQGETLCRKAR